MYGPSPRRPTARCSSATTPRCLVVLVMLLLLSSSMSAGCASYTEQLRETRGLTVRGEFSEALQILDQRLGVDSELQVPAKLEGDAVLLLLERATILQGQGRYALSARDMIIVDQHLDWLDIDHSSLDELGTYLYSQSKSNYLAPPYERLLLNTLNMINFLALYNLEDARVEARRFALMERYFIDDTGEALSPELISLGNYLSGATFEGSGDYEQAARCYSRAWRFGLRDEELHARLRDLYRVSGYSGRELQDPFFDTLHEEARAAGSLSRQDYVARHQLGDTLVLSQYGFVPYKQAIRVPLSRAASISSSSLDAQTRAQVVTMGDGGAITHINFPVLGQQGLPERSLSSSRVTIDGANLALTQGMVVSQAVEKAWDRLAGTLMAAAVTRALTRATVGEGGRAASSIATQSRDPATATLGVLGMVASLGAEVALEAADTPDTRSWTTLPAYIRIARTTLPAGMHTFEGHVHGKAERQLVPIWRDRLNVVNFSRTR